MISYRNLLLLALIGFGHSEDLVGRPCSKDDKKCLTEATSKFIETTSAGIPQYNIKTLEPLVIPTLDVVVCKHMGLKFHFQNLTITGLKNHIKFSDFVMDTDTKNVQLKTKAENLHIVGDLDIGFAKKDKKLSGVYTSTVSALVTTTYNYTFENFNDSEHFIVGPETNACEILGEPSVSISNDLQNSLDNDPDARSLKSDYEAKKDHFRKKVLCKIVSEAYGPLVHNIRAAAKIFPKTYFFIGV